IVILRAVVNVTVPVPLVAMSDEEPEKLIVLLALPARFLFAASVTAPPKVIVLNSLPADPIVRLALKSGRALTAIVSAVLPRLIFSELLGFAKSVVSMVTLKRDKVLLVPSSASVTAF